MRDERDGRRSTLHWAWYALAAFGLVFTAAVAVMVAHRAESSSDFRDFWNTALHFRQSGEIAADRGVHNYLPFFTIFMTPWTMLPLRAAAVVFTCFSLVLLALSVWLVETLLGERQRRGPRAALLVAVGLALPYVYACAVVGNVGLLVLFLVVATWFLVERGREWEAGLALGLALLIKLLPAVLLVFFLLKRRWRLASSAAIIVVVLGAGLPLAALGWRQTLATHAALYGRALEDQSAYQTITCERPLKAHYNNNALPIVLRRLLSPLNAGTDDAGNRLSVTVTDWPRTHIFVLYGVLLAAVLGVTVAVTLRGPPQWPPESIDEGRAVRSQFGAWCCLMLLAAPLVWTHYLPLVYWSLAVVADRLDRRQRAGGRDWLAAGTLGVWLIGIGLLAWPVARAAGAQLATVLCLWIASVWFSRRGA